ncbi:MAG: hypothetical protein L6R39_001112 [Caloplaca ligustica]|nr:MAG: hypothetical protein L6R39_001112 [Caloplaca ligustica]
MEAQGGFICAAMTAESLEHVATTPPSRSHSTSTQQTATQQTPTQQAPVQPASPAAVPADSHHSLNVGAAIGGAVGGGVLLASLIALLCLRRRKRKRRPVIRVIKGDQYELPSEDPTFRANSMLFPAELHPQVSKSSLNPPELENKESPASKVSEESQMLFIPAELGPSEQSTGPYELHGTEIDTPEMPTPRLERPDLESIRRSSSYYSRDAGWDEPSAVDGAKDTGLGFRRPSNRRRVSSMSGPWHDAYDKTNVF